jgi:Ca2+-binding EF-hand superfamily protein
MITFQVSRPDWNGRTDVFNMTAPQPPAVELRGDLYSMSLKSLGNWFMRDNGITIEFPSFRDTLYAETTAFKWRSPKTNLTLQLLDLSVAPPWLVPTRFGMPDRDLDVASQYNECSVCFFELFRLPVGILRYHSRRSCGHYFHTECAQFLMKKNKETLDGSYADPVCPLCAAKFTEVKTLPDVIKDPRAWFQMCDADLGGTLDKQEVMSGLGAVLPVERDKLERAIDQNWSTWDETGDGSIALDEFSAPKKGLREFIVKNFFALKKDSIVLKPADIPDLANAPLQWFEYWDRDGSGTLERDELIRAMVKTFCVTTWGQPIFAQGRNMKEIAIFVWRDLGYKDFDLVRFEEFSKPYGLGDQIYHNYTSGMFFGEDEEPAQH